MIKPLIEYYRDGTIKELVKLGMVSPSKLNYLVYVNCVNEYINRGLNKSEAVLETSIKCKVCVDTVWRSIRTIKEATE